MSLATASQLLLGQPQYAFYSVVAELAFVLWKEREDGRWGLALRWASAKAVGVMLATIQLATTWDCLSASVRSDPALGFSLSYSLHPRNLQQLWAPFTVRHVLYPRVDIVEFGVYDGCVSTAAVAWALARWNASGRRARPALGSAAPDRATRSRHRPLVDGLSMAHPV